jgi:hypothetical protein
LPVLAQDSESLEAAQKGQTNLSVALRAVARAMDLTGALCCAAHAVTGFANKAFAGTLLRTRHPGTNSATALVIYDLRRLRVHGLIERVPHTTPTRSPHKGSRAAPCSARKFTADSSTLIAASDERPRTTGIPTRAIHPRPKHRR